MPKIDMIQQFVSEIDLTKGQLENNPESILKIATAWHSYKTHYLFKLNQILKHDWITQDDLSKVRQGFEKENFSKISH